MADTRSYEFTIGFEQDGDQDSWGVWIELPNTNTSAIGVPAVGEAANTRLTRQEAIDWVMEVLPEHLNDGLAGEPSTGGPGLM
ncbi:MAG TPA: hypothetical protein VHJ78_10910 [Actinomycetota bacterium]|nr:hypothetical protein [Actinomycetota bacterium]